MLMMLAGGSLAKDAPADAHDADRLGFRAKGVPADGHDAGRLGFLWRRTPQLMPGLGFSGKGRPS